ncbi:hypothetical protein PR001_g10079 [Phytophthora rubi]|uniref:HTH CENPB-type domain-containing protein n=1 Tax=Phytophthora rubi TaxID=129364 RepID=A0A6A3MQ06_9STRA|nr:hypothetical protein PR001_g10079 [Phytophthora rubi]
MHEQARRMRLTKQQQLDLCAMHTRGPTWSLAALGEWAREKFALEKAPGKSSVKRILDKESSLKQIAADFRCRKKTPRASMVALDSCLVEMVLYAEQEHVPISGRMLMILGRLYSEALHIPVSERPRFTRDGWLKHFLRRYGLRHRRGHGEIGSVDLPAARKAALTLRKKIAKYHPNDVFNMDEAAFFYKASPTSSICLVSGPARKKKKDRQKPRWLPKKPPTALYQGTSKGWMTVLVFQDWLRDLDKSMGEAGRKILLLMDNAPVHITPDDTLADVEVEFLPPNTTAAIQPMDQGVIAWIKRRVLQDCGEEAVWRLCCELDPLLLRPRTQ